MLSIRTSWIARWVGWSLIIVLLASACLVGGGGQVTDDEVARRSSALSGTDLAPYAPPPEPDFNTQFTRSVVSSQPVGSIPGQSSVTPDGAFSYSLPLRVPEGRLGMAPSLSLEYNSRAGNGVVGVGWDLVGVSRITRCRKTLAEDERIALVRLTPDDSFCLDGVKLMLVSGADGAE